ncbi:MAG: hypothetical protein MK364_04425, partial [Pirellulales bacterium]|nr:hypothetical protein [Pirellulales bacterium]
SRVPDWEGIAVKSSWSLLAGDIAFAFRLMLLFNSCSVFSLIQNAALRLALAGEAWPVGGILARELVAGQRPAQPSAQRAAGTREPHP